MMYRTASATQIITRATSARRVGRQCSLIVITKQPHNQQEDNVISKG